MNSNLQDKINIFKATLLQENAEMNLISASDVAKIDARHVQDSLQLINYIPSHISQIIDLGSGAGFPGVIIAAAFEDKNIILCEKSPKKSMFLARIKHLLQLNNVSIFNYNLRETFPRLIHKNVLVTARAFKPLVEILDLLELHDFFNKYCTSLLLLKGNKCTIEINESKMKYKFEHSLNGSLTNNGFVLEIKNVKKI